MRESRNIEEGYPKVFWKTVVDKISQIRKDFPIMFSKCMEGL